MIMFLVSLLVCLLAFFTIILVHEFGHFMMAKLLHVPVLRFSIGFGRALFKWRWYQTDYQISLIPLGGYVKFIDEMEGPVSAADLPKAFNRQPMIKRILIILSGPLMNFVLAFIALWLMFLIGVQSVRPVIGGVIKGSIAAQAGLHANQEIISVGEKKVSSWQKTKMMLLLKAGGPKKVNLTVRDRTSGMIHTYPLFLSSSLLRDQQTPLLRQLGISPYLPTVSVVIQKVKAKGPAEQSGLLPQDQIMKIAGKPVHNFVQMLDLLSDHSESSVQIVIKRSGVLKKINITPVNYATLMSEQKGYIGVNIREGEWPKDLVDQPIYNFLEAFVPAIQELWWLIVLTVTLLIKIITGSISLDLLGGPLSIVYGFSISFQSGLSYFLQFLGLVNISLAVLNLLPIPVLDGGYLVYYVAELIQRRPISVRTQRLATLVGTFFLVGIMAIAVFNDLAHLWHGLFYL